MSYCGVIFHKKLCKITLYFMKKRSNNIAVLTVQNTYLLSVCYSDYNKIFSVVIQIIEYIFLLWCYKFYSNTVMSYKYD